MKKVIKLIIVMLFIAGSVNASRDTKYYDPELLDASGKVHAPVSIKIIDPAKAPEADKKIGNIIGWLGDPACGAEGLSEGCAVIHDPHGQYHVKETTTREKKGPDYVGDVRGSKIKHTGDKHFKVHRVYKNSENSVSAKAKNNNNNNNNKGKSIK